MKKYLSFSALFILVGLSAFLPFSFADDVSDMMDAALAEQTQPKSNQSAAVSSSVDQAPAAETSTATAPSGDEKPYVPSISSEPTKARDVLATEESSGDDSDAANTENLDADGKPIPSRGALLEAAATSGELMMADFNSGDKPNNLGGDFGGFAKDPNDDTQDCRATFASDDALGDMEGFALRLDYDVDSPSPAYNGFWMKLENVNANPYDTLSFYVRGASHRFTKRLKVELKTPDHRSSSYFISGISDQWKKIEIPLKRFKGIKDWAIMSELVLVFDDVNTAPKKGTLLVDQIALERKEKGMKTVAAVIPSKSAPTSSPEVELSAAQ